MFETLVAFLAISSLVAACSLPLWITGAMAFAFRWMWPIADGHVDIAAFKRKVARKQYTAFQESAVAKLHTVGTIRDVDDTTWLHGVPKDVLPGGGDRWVERADGTLYYKVRATCNLTRYVYAYVEKTPETTAVLRNLKGLIELKGTVYAGRGDVTWYMYPAEVRKAPKPRIFRWRRKSA